MDIIVDRPQLVRTVLLYLNMNFGNLTPKKRNGYVNSVFYVNPSNEVMMEYDKGTERVYINYGQIWLKIESLFHLNYSDVQSIIKVWLEEKPYELVGVTPLVNHLFSQIPSWD
jgi:hypothetical protein